jgi:hypothetical protein
LSQHQSTLPNEWALVCYDYFRMVPSLHTQQMRFLRHVCKDILLSTRQPIACTTTCVREMLKLPYGELRFGEWRWSNKYIFRKDVLCAVILHHGVLPTGQWDNDILHHLRCIEQDPVDALPRYCSCCPFCGESRDRPPDRACSIKWAEWGGWIPFVKRFGSCRWQEKKHWLVQNKFTLFYSISFHQYSLGLLP